MNYAKAPKILIVETEIITSLKMRLIMNKLRKFILRVIDNESIQFQGSVRYSNPEEIIYSISNDKKYIIKP